MADRKNGAISRPTLGFDVKGDFACAELGAEERAFWDRHAG